MTTSTRAPLYDLFKLIVAIILFLLFLWLWLGIKQTGSTQTNEALVFTYRQRGVQIIYASLDGVAIIFLQTREAGDIGGVRLGDRREEVLARWGQPSSVQGPSAYYRAGSAWVVIVKLDDDDVVKELGLGRLTENPPQGAKFFRKKD